MAGGPYNIPRNTKGEGRFFYIFSTKALIVTIIFGIVGIMFALIIYAFLLLAGIKTSNALMCLVGAIIFGSIGFIISSFKIPDSNNFEITRKAGGEYIDQIIIRFIKFKMRRNKIYTFFTEEKKNER